MKYVRELDLWELYPTFFYSEISKSLKSYFNGMIFILFAIFSISFFILQFLSFVNDIDLLVSSRIEEEKITKANISTTDVYFGLSLYEFNEDNYSDIPKSDIEKYFTIDFTIYTNSNDSEINIKYEKCRAEDFYDFDEWDELTNEYKQKLIKLLNNYTCPIKNKPFIIEVNNLTQSSSYIRVGVSLKQENFKEAMEYIRKHNIYAQLIYSNYFMNIENRYKPFNSEIQYQDMLINPNLYRYFLLQMYRYQVSDDVSLLPSRNYQFRKNNKFGLDEGSYYLIEDRYSEVVQFFSNRTIDSLKLVNFYINLSQKSRRIYRDFPKFTTFLAGTNSIISSIFGVFSIIANFINSTFMKMALTRKRMYTFEILNFSKEIVKNETPLIDKEIYLSKKKSEQLEIVEMPEKKQLDDVIPSSNNNKLCIL
jgi:hypothetical protein